MDEYKGFIYNYIRKVVKEVLFLEIEEMYNKAENKLGEMDNKVENKLRETNIIRVFEDKVFKIQPYIEESMKKFLLDKLREGKYPSDTKDYWSCIFCGHIAPKNDGVKYCSGCGARW